MIDLLPPDAACVAELASRLRLSDRAELDALQPGLDYGLVLHTCVGLSVWVRALWRGNIPLAVTGVIPNADAGGLCPSRTQGGTGGAAPHPATGGTHAPWLVGTDSIYAFREQFKRAVRGIVEDVYRPRFAPLLNHVDARQAGSIRFLRALGFTLHEAEALGAEGNPFRKFTMGCKGA